VENELTKIGVRLRFTSRQTILMVVAEKLVQEINGFVRDISLIFRSNEASPWLPLVPARQNMHCGEVRPSIVSNDFIHLPNISSYCASSSISYFSRYAYSSSVPKTLVIFTS
jgi:hypothetical protein